MLSQVADWIFLATAFTTNCESKNSQTPGHRENDGAGRSLQIQAPWRTCEENWPVCTCLHSVLREELSAMRIVTLTPLAHAKFDCIHPRYLGIYDTLSSYHLHWLHVDSEEELHQGIWACFSNLPRICWGFPSQPTNRAKWISVGPSLAMMKKTWIMYEGFAASIAGKVWTGASWDSCIDAFARTDRTFFTYHGVVTCKSAHAKTCLLAKVDFCLHHLSEEHSQANGKSFLQELEEDLLRLGTDPSNPSYFWLKHLKLWAYNVPIQTSDMWGATWYEMSSPASGVAQTPWSFTDWSPKVRAMQSPG